MSFIDRLKNSLKIKEKASVSAADESPALAQETIESLWFSLCDDPNDKENIPRLLSLCETRGGPAAVYAALEELARMQGSWLPQTYLGRIALEQRDYPQAYRWYQRVLSSPEPQDYALFMISADLGRYGFAAQIPELLANFYDVEKNDIHIGLNLLQSYVDVNDSESGQALLKQIRRHDSPEIHEYLEGFADAFSREDREGGPIGIQAVQTPSQTVGQEVPVMTQLDEEAIDVSRLPRAVQIDVPVWKRDLYEMEDFLPNIEKRRRVGVYMYADTSARGIPLPPLEGAVHPSDLAVSLPLFIGERLLFTTHYAPIALYPVSREKGPQSESLEPDVQSLFALCTKEALDFIITGTVFHDGSVYRIRSWILDKAKQSARIVAKDLPVGSFGEPFNNMINDIMLLFFDKRYVKPAGRSEFTYAVPSPELVPTQLEALSYLLHQHLVLVNICDASILPDDKKLLDACASLTTTDTRNQMYLMMFLAAMKNVRLTGSNEYLNYRQQLYESADRNRYSACVKATMEVINSLLQD